MALWKKKKSLGFLKRMLLFTYGGIYYTLQNTNLNKNNKVLVRKSRTRKEGKSQRKWTKLVELAEHTQVY